MRIAKQLDGRREERERRITAIAAELEAELRGRGIDASVSGRAKHIYSIWRKMQAKNVDISQVHDVRAVRVLVPDIAQCYAALGVIHTEWRHVPSEFDDYIAAPKENGYRSIHTAVVGPDGRTLEVQIRTRDMHEEAELGVCAHWSYKESGAEDRPYAEKMNWLRQVVEWRDDVEQGRAVGGRDLGEELRQLFEESRIFVSTPRGHVLDLAQGATPVDFAYRVHTEIGHRCRGALVEGRPAPLNAALATGQRVEIVTGEVAAPERFWLDSHLGYVTSARAREKIRDWFRSLEPEVNERAGRARIVQLIDSLGAAPPTAERWRAAAARLGYQDAAELCRAVGTGDCQTLDALELLDTQPVDASQLDLIPRGGGSTIAVCRVEVRGQDRRGLLAEVLEVLGDSGISVLENAGHVDPVTEQAWLALDIRRPALRELAVIVDRIAHLDGVSNARVARR
jgi:GTP pyrophosphokinase